MVGEQGSSALSVKHLMNVFKLCDPDRSGRIKIGYLQELAAAYAPHGEEVGFGFLLV